MIKRTISLLCLCVLCCHTYTIAQNAPDTTGSTKNPGNTSWDFGFGSFYQAPFANFENYADPLTVKLPEESFMQRRYGDIELQKLWDLNNDNATDNPLFHEAFYLDLQASHKLSKDITIQGRTVIEHRGNSYGVYNVKNIALYPQYRISFNKKIAFLKDSIAFSINYGNFNNFKFAEGLTIYNLDIYGNYSKIIFKRFDLEYLHIADLFQGIGLNIDDAFYSGLSYTVKNKSGLSWRSGVHHTFLMPTGTDLPPFSEKPDNMVDINTALYKSSKFRLYGQSSFRYNIGQNFPGFRYNNRHNVVESCAALLGASIKKSSKKFNIEVRAEGRYYGSLYKMWFVNTNVYYRNKDQESYSNTVGSSLYPIIRYNRPFGQWAVYTEYNRGINMLAASAEINMEYALHKNVSISGKTDLHILKPEDHKIFTYPFYDLGFSLHSKKEYGLYLGITNKGMNLDKHYPTYYLFKKPVVMLKLYKNITQFKSDFEQSKPLVD